MPIRWRLALLYGAVSSLVLGLVLIVAYGLYGRSQYQNLDRLLLGTSQQTEASISTNPNPPHQVLLEPELLVVMRQYTTSGQPVQGVSNRVEPQVPQVDPRQVLTNPSGPAFDPIVGLVYIPRRPPEAPANSAFGVIADQEARWRSLVTNLGTRGFLEVSTPLAPLDAAMFRVRLVLAGMWLVGTALLLLVSLSLAGRALAPIARLTASARGIAQSQDFSERLSKPAYHDDLGRLSDVLNEMLGSLEAQFRQLELVTRGAPIGLALLDTRLRYLEINETLARWNGQPRANFLGRTPAGLLGQTGAWIEEQLRRVLASGQEIIGLEQDVREPSGRLSTCLMASFYPVFAGNSMVAVGCVVQDITERKLAEEQIQRLNASLEQQVRERTREADAARERAEILAALGDALQTAHTPEEVTETVAQRIGPALDAQYVALSIREGEVMRLAHVWGHLPAPLEQAAHQGLTRARGGLLWRAVLSAQAVYSEDYAQEPDRAVQNLEGLSIGVEPVVGLDGRVRATVSVGRLNTHGPWLDGERDLMRRAAMALGLALERADQATRLEERMMRAVDAAGVGLWELDLETGEVITGGRYAELYGLDASRTRFARGDLASLVSPEDLHRIQVAQRQSAESGKPFEIEFRVRRSGRSTGWLLARGQPQRVDSQPPRRLLGTIMDISSRKRAEERAEALRGLAVRLASTVTRQGVIEAVLDQGMTALGAVAGSVALITEDGTGLEIVGSRGYPPEAVKPWQRFPINADAPLAEAARSGHAVWLENLAVFEERYPQMRGVQGRNGHGAWAALALRTEGTMLGVIGLSFAEARGFGPEERAFALTIADQCAVALERARLFEAETQARRGLQQTTAQLEAMLENAPVGLAFFDRDLRFVRINRELAEINGLEAEKHLGRRMSELMPSAAQGAVEVEQKLRHVLESGQAIIGLELSGPSLRDPHEVRHSLASWYPVKVGPETVLVGAVVMDITDRKRAENLLERYRLLSENARDIIWILGSDGTIMEANRAATQAYGFSRNELIGMNIRELREPSTLPAVAGQLEKAFAGSAEFETVHRRRDGSTFPVEVRATGANFGTERLILAIARDVTERKRLEQGLRESEERLRLGVGVANLGLAEVDYASDTVHLSKEAAVLYGLGETELTVSRPQFHATFHPDEREQLERELAQALDPNSQGLFEREHRILLPNSEERWLNVRKQVFFDRSSPPHRPSRALIAALDITERKRREATTALLDEITLDLSRLSRPDEIMQAVGAKVGAFLRVPYCHFMSIDEDRDEVVYLARWNAAGVLRLPDTVRLSDHITEEFRALAHAGQTVAIENTGLTQITRGEANAAINAISFITVPFSKNNRWAYQFSVHDVRPRVWREDEVELVRELANRVFPRLEQARTEELLRESEFRYRTFFDSVDEGFCVCEMILDQDGQPVDYRFLEVNRLFEEQTGLHNAAGRTALELVPDLEPEWIEVYGRVALTGEPARFSQGSDAMGRWFDVFASRVGEPGDLRFAILFKDVTERKRLERNVRQSEERYRALVQAGDQAVWAAPPEAGGEQGIRWWQELTGQTPQQSAGLGWLEVVHPDDREAAQEFWRRGLETRTKFEIGYRVRDLEGRYRDLVVRGVPILEANGSLRQWVGTMRDVTERKRAERDAAFLTNLSERLSQITDPKALIESASSAICQHLGASRCTMAELYPEVGKALVQAEYTDGPPSLIGAHDLTRFGMGNPGNRRIARTTVNHDLSRDPRTSAYFEGGYGPLGLGSLVSVPLSRANRLVGTFNVAQRNPRRWTDAEVSLIETAAERTWNALERARSETELRQSEERFRTLIAATANVVFTTNPEGEMAPPQPGWAAFTGQNEADYAGLGWLNAIHPDDRLAAAEAWSQSLRERRTHQHENRLRRFDGEYRTVVGRAVPIIEADGLVREWVGTITDITEQRQAEREREQLLKAVNDERSLLDTFLMTSPVGFAFLDSDLRFRRVNKALAEMNGVPPSAHLGHRIEEVVPNLATTARPLFERVLETGEPLLDLELTGETVGQPGVKRSWLENIYPVRSSNGTVLGMGAVVVEITERKRIEYALETQAKLLREQADLLALVKETVIVRDPEDRIVSWNRAAEEMYGFSSERSMGRVSNELLETHFSGHETPQSLRATLEQHGFWEGELTHLRRDGTRIVVLSRQALQRDEHGQPTAILEVNWDITERKRAEDALHRMAETQKRFVSDASHELRAPLTAIQGNLELVLRYPDMPLIERREALTEAAREAARLGRLVSDLLSLARGDSGTQQMLFEETDLRAVLLEAWAEAHHLKEGQTLELGRMDALEVEGNRDRLKQLALILLDNALKYTLPEGTVRLELHQDGNWAEFRVADNGPGIAPEDLPHVFERFYRADPSRTHSSDPGGTGLGLPIAQWIAQTHGGEIRLESQLGRGTTAVVRLPLLNQT